MMRDKLFLDGIWGFKLDPNDIGETEKWNENKIKYDFDIKVPGIWQNIDSTITDYTGIAWYFKNFDYTNVKKSDKIFLHFDAVDYYTRVWINNEYAGEHEGGFTPFEFDVSKFIKNGVNHISVRVFDPSDNSEIPIGKQGSWYTKVSGIWQSVYLEDRNKIFIENVLITPNIAESKINVNVGLFGEIRNEKVIRYSISSEENSNLILKQGDIKINDKNMNFIVKIEDPILWNLDNPYLYKLKLEIIDEEVIDRFEDDFGMRNVGFSNGKVTINGEPVYIRGALDQGYHPDTIYYAPSDDYIINEINQAKAMGFNLLRKHIKVEIPRYLYWADKLGILIWAETPNYIKWTDVSRIRFENEMFSMIKRDYNHPSIIIWSLYNEEWGLEWNLANDKDKQKYIISLYNNVKNLDNTRLICDNSGWKHVKTDINDHHRYFVCPEQIEDWKNDITEYVTGDLSRNFVNGYHENGEPVIISEFGTWGLPSINNIKNHYNGNPEWFHNKGDDTHKEDYKSPLEAEKNFKKFSLDNVFKDFDELASISRKRMFRSNKALIEEMRNNSKISGYVVTEFTDVEWETNGFLDFFRNPKFSYDDINHFNSDICIITSIDKHNFWEDEEASWNVTIVNNKSQNISGKLLWYIKELGLSGEINVNLSNELTRLRNIINIKMPHVNHSGKYYFNIKLIDESNIIASNKEEITISPRYDIKNGCVYPYKMLPEFIEKLKSMGYKISDKFENNTVVVTNFLDKYAVDFARQGGKVIFLAEEGDKLKAKEQLTFRELPKGESWARTSSLNFVDTSYFENIPLEKEVGWEASELLPDYVIPFSNYNKPGGALGQIVYFSGNQYNSITQKIISGYFQGWIGQFGGSIVNKKSGHGNITIVTWKLMNNYKIHPIATEVLDTLIFKS